jgi:hypothetical protein
MEPLPSQTTLFTLSVESVIQEQPGTYSIVEAYDPATDTWSTKASMPIPVFDAYAVVYNGYIYIVGGASDSYSAKVNTLMAYQIATNTWTTLAPLNVKKSGSGLGLFGSRIIAAGGATANAFVSDNEAYDIPSNTWTIIAPLPEARFNGCSGAIGNALYFGGGQTAGGAAVNTLDAYDSSSNSWTTGLPTMPFGVAQIGSVVYKGDLYCFGGENINNVSFNYLQIYHPAAASLSVNAFGTVNNASFATGSTPLAPGTIAAVFGTSLDDGSMDAFSSFGADGKLINSLGGASVSFSGVTNPVPIFSAFPQQLNIEIPQELAGASSATIQVTVNGQMSAPQLCL